MTNIYHIPILVNEILDGLQITEGKRYIDATIGGGGHTIEILRRGAGVLGIDADWDAVNFTKKRLEEELPEKKEGKDWRVVQGNFRNIVRIAGENGFEEIDGMLFDLGVSSYQLDSPDKGFTYRVGTGALDLRFDQKTGEKAADFIWKATEDDLYEVFAKFGEEELARPIAHAFVRARVLKPIDTVDDVVRAVDSVITDKRKLNAVLSRIFQALRIVANDEFGALKEGLIGAQGLLKRKGRLAVISFHSLEDRTVKLFFRNGTWREITKKPMCATDKEIYENRRARSAKLRIAEKI
jgi:16S rRNA (cytosine1402-N4)-methyltransferase